jgi:hypothetical protein
MCADGAVSHFVQYHSGHHDKSSGVACLPLDVMPGEGRVTTSCSAGRGKNVDTGPSPGMTT